MAAITWSDNYSVGVPVLDEDHKQLIAIINRVVDDIDNGRLSVWALSELEDYAREHFVREEAMLAAVHYEGLDEHKREHRQFVEWLQSVEHTEQLATDGYTHVGEIVSDYLKDWLINHILATDMDYCGILE